MTNLFGIYRGRVVDAADPDHRRRLNIEVMEIADLGARWALPCVPVASRALPIVGAQVWVMFERGDPAFPVWMGVLP